jgi:hypothetical protein
MLTQSDEDLIRALGNGDESALRTLVDRHTASIYRFSVRYTGDESLAQDICQEVFLKVYRYSRRYKPGMSFKTWLFTIVELKPQKKTIHPKRQLKGWNLLSEFCPRNSEQRLSSSTMRKCPRRRLLRSWRRPFLRWNRCSCAQNVTL